MKMQRVAEDQGVWIGDAWVAVTRDKRGRMCLAIDAPPTIAITPEEKLPERIPRHRQEAVDARRLDAKRRT